MKTFIISKNGFPLYPTENQKWITKVIKSGEGKIIKIHPFNVLKLQNVEHRPTKKYTLGVSLGIDKLGFSVVDWNAREIIGGEYKINDIEKGLVDKEFYRQERLKNKRNRKVKDNHSFAAKMGQIKRIAIKHKIDCQVAMVEKLLKVLPIDEVNIVGLSGEKVQELSFNLPEIRDVFSAMAQNYENLHITFKDCNEISERRSCVGLLKKPHTDAFITAGGNSFLGMTETVLIRRKGNDNKPTIIKSKSTNCLTIKIL